MFYVDESKVKSEEDSKRLHEAILSISDMLVRHNTGCSNQNVVNPIGSYVNARQCHCNTIDPTPGGY